MDTGILISVIAIVVLLILSAFLSASETAITAASRPRLRHLAQEGNRRATLAERLIDAREQFLGAVLLGNNLVNILASALATGALITLFGDAGVAYATIIMTIVVVLFGEVLPKTYALRHPTRTALAVAAPARALLYLLSPFVATLTAIVELILRGLGTNRVRVSLVTPQEELRSTIQLQAEQGGIFKRERDMLHGVIDLAETTVEDVMIHRKNMVLIDADQPPAEIVARVIDIPHTRVPLWRRNPENIVGVLHVKDLLREVATKGGQLASIDIESICAKPWFVPETTSLVEQMTAFRSRQSHFALVVDEYGALMGLVTLQDILDEIVGPISDEYDVVHQGIRKQSDGSVVIEGAMTIRDLNRELGWDLPDDQVVTVAGLVLHESRSIPDVGQVFSFYDTRFEILRRQRNQVTLLRLSRIAPPAAAS
ncbi:MAG: HlyC/CorC family transporter [Alphaproteobacteria bacterium]|nr:HlyC/CorC family transporter [Alphaproteobacteria bacterium]